MKYEYGIMSTAFTLEAEDKLIAYATMLTHYNNNPNLIVIYAPEEAKKDMWMNIDGTTEKRLDELYGGKGAFVKFVDNKDNRAKIAVCAKTIKQV